MSRRKPTVEEWKVHKCPRCENYLFGNDPDDGYGGTRGVWTYTGCAYNIEDKSVVHCKSFRSRNDTGTSKATA